MEVGGGYCTKTKAVIANRSSSHRFLWQAQVVENGKWWHLCHPQHSIAWGSGLILAVPTLDMTFFSDYLISFFHSLVISILLITVSAE